MTGVVVAAGLVIVAVAVSWRMRLGLERELAVTALRASVQLTAVGALVAVVFAHGWMAAGFVSVMLGAASLTSARRLAGVPRAVFPAGAAIALGAGVGLAALLVSGAFATSARAVVPLAGILIGGAMAATSLTGRRLLDDVSEGLAEIEARLALGAPALTALAPLRRRAVRNGLIPALDQTKNVGLVTLPGTFVGLILGGASAAQAARVQLTVLLALLGVEVIAAVACAELVARASVRRGERVVALTPPGG